MSVIYESLEELLELRTVWIDGCRVWTGARFRNKDGPTYGQVRWESTNWRVHRLVWTTYRGEIPDGILCCHTCDNPPCCNLEHLFLGTQSDNINDAVAKGRFVPYNNPHFFT